MSEEIKKIKVSNIKKSIVFFSLLLLFLIFVVGVISIYKNAHTPKTVKLINITYENDSSTINEKLTAKDYDSYQSLKLQYATRYYKEKQYGLAKKQLNEILTNIPQKSVSADTYIYLCYISEIEERKDSYCEAAVNRLKEYGSTNEAKIFAQEHHVKSN